MFLTQAATKKCHSGTPQPEQKYTRSANSGEGALGGEESVHGIDGGTYRRPPALLPARITGFGRHKPA